MRTDTIIPDIACAETLQEGMAFDSVSHYRLKRRLGEGGMGEVWLAERISAGAHSQMVAVKFLRSADAGEMLADEALRISRLSHDNIVPFIDSGRDSSGRFFVAMAYVQGVDLSELRKIVGLDSDAVYSGSTSKRLPDPMVGFIMFMVLRALHYAHTYRFESGELGLIHRDVSPGNILIDEIRGFVKLTDFGVAIRESFLSSQGQVAGKVPYMAPEVLTGEPADTRSDLYALGLVTYELLTGFNPNVRPSELTSVLGAITSVMMSLDRPLRPPEKVIEGIDPFLSRIVARLLEKAPDDRYQSAEAAMNDVSLCLYDKGVGPTTDSLASYMKLLRSPNSEELQRKARSFPFLRTTGNDSEIHPSWILTDQARKSLDDGANPGRD